MNNNQWLQDLKDKLDADLKRSYSPFVPVVKLWWNVEDVFYNIYHDIKWLLTDRTPEIPAEPCDRLFCRDCGNLPWKSIK